jgi:uncharacterized membrane protein
VPPAWRLWPRLLGPARLAGATAGVGMVVYLVWVEVWELRAICLWCTVVHVLAFVLFVAVVAGSMSDPDDPEGPDQRPGQLRVPATLPGTSAELR